MSTRYVGEQMEYIVPDEELNDMSQIKEEVFSQDDDGYGETSMNPGNLSHYENLTSVPTLEEYTKSEVLRRNPMHERRSLTLEEKVWVIEEGDAGKSQRELARQYHCSKTQIYQILKNKDTLLKEWRELNNNVAHKSQTTAGSEIPKCYQAGNSSDPISSLLLPEKVQNTLASTGNLVMNSSCPKHTVLDSKILSDIKPNQAETDKQDEAIQKSSILSMIQNHPLEDIYVITEMCLLYDLFPKQSKMTEQKLRKNENRLVVLLCMNGEGKKESLSLVYSSSLSFSFDMNTIMMLGANCYTNEKGFVTSDIMCDWLQQFNKRMAQQNRKILLLLQDDLCYRYDGILSNITLLFMSTTSFNHALFAREVAKFLKIEYRKRLLKYVLANTSFRIDATNDVSLAEAIIWLLNAWQEIPPLVIKTAFTIHIFSDSSANMEKCSLLSSALSELGYLQGVLAAQYSDGVPPFVYATCDAILPVCEHALQEISNAKASEDSDGGKSGRNGNEVCTVRDALKVVASLKTFATKVQNIALFQSVVNVDEHLVNMVAQDYERKLPMKS